MDISANVALEPPGRPRTFVLLLLLYVLLYVVPLGVRPIASPDESRYGEIPREMIASGDWVSPRFNGVRYFEKPVLGHWLNAASLAAFGENAFAVRLPVALATGLTALILFFLARRFLSQSTASLTVLIFLTTFLVAGAGTFAVLDAFLALFLTGALATYYVAMEEQWRGPRLAYLVLCGGACAGAFLVKGFIGLALPVVVAAPYLVARRRWGTLFGSPWVPIATATAFALPWAVLIHFREPDFWHYFFWVEHIRRFAGGDAQHSQPFWYYVAYLPLTGWPWFLFMPAALAGLRGAGDARFLGYLAAWAVLPLLFLSIAHGKLQTYILPCFGPLAILVSVGLEGYLRTGRRLAFRVAAALMGVAFATILAAVLALQVGGDNVVYDTAEQSKLVAFIGFMAVGMGCALVAFRRSSQSSPRLVAIAVAGAVLILPLHVALPERFLEQAAPSTTIARHAAPAPDSVIVTEADLFGAAAWSLKRDDVYVVSPGEIEYGLSYPESRHRWLRGAMLAQLIEENRGRREILVFAWSTSAAEIESLVPPRAARSEHGALSFWRVPK